MDKGGHFKNIILLELIEDLDVIEHYYQPDKKLQIGEITAKQKILYSAMAVGIAKLLQHTKCLVAMAHAIEAC